MRQILENAQRQQQFVQRGERLQENQIAAAFEQRADLLAEKRLAIVGGKFAVRRAQRKRPDRSADENIAVPVSASRATCAARQLISAHLIIEAEARQPHAVRAEAVRLDHLRAGIGVLAINAARAVPAG